MDEENTLKILVASDIHLGYKEKDSAQEKDSFNSFEEVFKIAQEKEADFVLLGGDLFHENKPSRKAIHSCMEIMRRYCLGSRPCQLEVLSDQAVDFGHTSSTITTVNYENPNLNISMPVFSIHGNHDDPAGSGSLSAIDLLSVAGFLNHFGRARSLEKINISPVLLQKGSTKLALYGLGSIRDERLYRLFRKKDVKFLCPKENTDEWFSIMVIHQNRAQHGATNYIPEQFLPNFLDLVIWGHEHESIIPMEWNSVQNFNVLQPGSTVATSLSPGESKQKHVTFLEIRGKEMRHEFIPLRTVRSMYVEDVVLKNLSCISEPSVPTVEEEIITYCKERVESLLQRAKDEHSGHAKQPKTPLIRLRIDYTGGYPVFNAYRVGASFTESVANADSVVHFLKKERRVLKADKRDLSGLDDMIVEEVVDKVKVEDLVEEYLTSQDKRYQLTLLSAKGMSMAVREFVIKYEKEAIQDLCGHQLQKIGKHVRQSKPDIMEREEILQEIEKYKLERNEASKNGATEDYENEDSIREILARVKQSRSAPGTPAASGLLSSDDQISDNESGASEAPRSKRGRGVRGRGSARGKSTRGKGRGRTTKAAITVETTSSARKTSIRKRENIMDAFTAASQRSRPPIIAIEDSDEDELLVWASTSSRRQNLPKRERNFDSDDDNPFAASYSGKKRR